MRLLSEFQRKLIRTVVEEPGDIKFSHVSGACGQKVLRMWVGFEPYHVYETQSWPEYHAAKSEAWQLIREVRGR